MQSKHGNQQAGIKNSKGGEQTKQSANDLNKQTKYNS